MKFSLNGIVHPSGPYLGIRVTHEVLFVQRHTRHVLPEKKIIEFEDMTVPCHGRSRVDLPIRRNCLFK
jgi:hypothetical protein